MLLLGPHAAPCRQLRGDEGVPPWLCATHGRPPLVVTSWCVSLRAGEMPVRFHAAAGHPHLQQDGQEGQLRPHLRLQGSLPARYGGVRGGPHLPAWPKLGAEEQLAEHPEVPSPGMREKECLWVFFLAEFGSSGWVCAAQEPGGGVLGAGCCPPGSLHPLLGNHR